MEFTAFPTVFGGIPMHGTGTLFKAEKQEYTNFDGPAYPELNVDNRKLPVAENDLTLARMAPVFFLFNALIFFSSL
jgi:hypothetical protein